MKYPETVPVRCQLDWWWGRSLYRAARSLHRDRPDVMLLQWWTAATLHTYLVLALLARLLGIAVLIEFHETQDSGEAKIPLVASYSRRLLPVLVRLSSGALVHTDYDVELLGQTYGTRMLRALPVEIAPHGPYDHLKPIPSAEQPPAQPVTRLLFFGLIRPYKGLEDLVTAFDELSEEEAASFRLTVVGETWEGWTLPAELIASNRHRDQITFVNRYVSDDEAAAYYSEADVVVLPYRRGSASGPLQIAMSNGLHVILYAVPGLAAAVSGYEGAHLVPPDDREALRRELIAVREDRSKRFVDSHSWTVTSDAITRLARRVGLR